MTVPPDPDRDERSLDDEDLVVERDESDDTDEISDETPDATAALHEAGGDADRAESLLESRDSGRRGEVIPDDDRPAD